MRSENDERLPLLDKTTLDRGLGDKSPSELGGCCSNIFFSWLTPLLDLGNKRPLEFSDLYQLNLDDRAVHISKTFKKHWNVEMMKSKPRLWLALAKSFGGPFIMAGFLKLLHDSMQFVAPMVIKLMIDFLRDPNAELRTGLLYALTIFAAGVIQSFSLRQYFFLCFETGLRFRSAVVTAVYQKSLVLAASAKAKKSTGEITNLMSIDGERLEDLPTGLHAVWYALFQIIGASYLLYLQLGYSFLAGVAVMLLLFPATAAVSKIMQGCQAKLMQVKDERMKVVYEVLSGMKIIKFQAWEHSYSDRVMQFRTKELNSLKAYLLASAGTNMIFMGVPAFVTIATFATYVYLGNTLDIGTALTSLALLNILRFPLFMLPQVINEWAEAQVSFNRLEEFFLMEEREPVTSGHLTETGIFVEDADFEWDASSDNETVISKGRYQNAIRVSCLTDDLKILPGGDMTEIGEKGINLSGGQRTRVAIARAVYQDADIYLLDDPLAAVDAHVGSDIFKRCIKNALKDKLVVLVTNGLNFLKDCDVVVVLEEGRIVEKGKYAELAGKTNGSLAKMMESSSTTSPHSSISVDGKSELDNGINITQDADTDASTNADETTIATLIEDEDRSTGDVPLSTYVVWIRACGGFSVAFLVIGLFVLGNVISLASTFWLSYWSENGTDARSQVYFLYVFCGLNALAIISYFVRSVALFMAGLAGSSKMFQALIVRILRAPMSFFDTTPLGRIVNRLSKDIYTLDESLPANLGWFLATAFNVITTLCTIVYVTPWFTIVLIPLALIYISSQRYFIKTSRELQRLDSISRSPVVSLLTETLEGLPTIHAFGAEEAYSARNEVLLDRNQRAYFLNFTANCWLALRLEFAGTIVATAAAVFAAVGHEVHAGEAFAGLAGVALSYAFDVTQSLNWTVRTLSTIQTQMVSVERINTYTTMDIEADVKAEPLKQLELENAKWPAAGALTFAGVDLRYRPGLPLVLKNLSFTIQPREKIGIVGRTGAGKSSLVVALMRLVELDAGQITMDGVDISTIGLHDLRDKISIIPQDPVLFSGTIRSNLDPFDRYDDDALWTAIKRANLHNAVASLDAKVDERGQNFSVGERQLICIARALLKKSKVILMDEATASIDPNTDRLIQESIRESFKDCTCLTIAHRINTILDSDRILVMDKGSAAEFYSPKELLKNPKGIFTNLVEHWNDDKSSH
ncbi:unnamed protein product [Aphanomyces euteiches]